MLAPPAAAWAVTQDRRWQSFYASLWALAAAAALSWLQQRSIGGLAAGQEHVGLWLSGGLVVCMAAGAWGWRLGLQPSGVLVWSGSQWSWQDASGRCGTVTPRVMMDLGGWLLLQLQPVRPEVTLAHQALAGEPAGPGWLSVRGPRDPLGGQAAPWAAFRAAVYSFGARVHGLTEPGNPSF